MDTYEPIIDDNLSSLDNRDVIEDPVCGMVMDPLAAPFVSRFGGVNYYFCSSDCKTQFDIDPGQFIGFDAA